MVNVETKPAEITTTIPGTKVFVQDAAEILHW